MFLKKIALLAAAPALALGVAWGASAANAAPMPAPVSVTTNFTYIAGSADLAVAAGNLTPLDGTAVHFDLQAAVHDNGPTLCGLVQALEGPAVGIPAADFSTGYVGVTCATAVLPASDETITLFVVNSHPGTPGSFEVAGTHGGTALKVPATVTPASGVESVSWLTHPVVPPVPPVHVVRPYVFDGHVITVNNTDATVGWDFGKYAAGDECALVDIWGFGFSTTSGSPHVGYTCFNASVNTLDNGFQTDTGYLAGLAAGHTYALEVIPATQDGRAGATALPNAQTGWIDVVTTK